MPRPSKAAADVTGRIASIEPIAKCLDLAITELKDEDESSYSNLNLFDSSMKQLLLKRYTDSVSEITWDEPGSSSKADGSTNSIPPAGVIQGKLSYYNRAGTQWRIVLSEAELRARTSWDDDVGTKNRKSLWDQCAGPSQQIPKMDTVKLDHVVIFAYDDI